MVRDFQGVLSSKFNIAEERHSKKKLVYLSRIRLTYALLLGNPISNRLSKAASSLIVRKAWQTSEQV